jgi:hypothetical protein
MIPEQHHRWLPSLFAQLQLGEIKNMHIVNFINDLKSPNPMDGVKKPKVEQKKMQYFND